MYGGEDSCILGFGGGTEARKQFERPRRRSECNNKMDLQDVGWKGLEWTDSA